MSTQPNQSPELDRADHSSGHTHDTAPTRFVEADGMRFAYRRFGNPIGTPTVLLQHFMGNLDNYDPAITNALATSREVILTDNAGVGLSTGPAPETVAGMAHDAASLIDALGLEHVDLFGFSMGGFVAQQIAFDRPELVRRLPPFHLPVFVLTHHEREPLQMEGGTTFTFVTGGVGAALAQAQDAAGPSKDVLIGGGANTLQQFLRAGLVDSFQLHVVPVLLGTPTRLLDGIEPGTVTLDRVVDGRGVTHLRYVIES